ncbi:MAG TPA: hypothetical protein VKR30_04840 [Candidatus Limnocylindrales bacterium]|nr:hypothetical protein [Candidatus Limnocylindrales bacterium]
MNPLISDIWIQRSEELRREADHERLLRLLASERTRSTWRRLSGSAARRLSATLDDVATRLDPVCRPSLGRPSYGRE